MASTGRNDWAVDVKTGTRAFSVVGLGVSALFLAGFGAWAGLAPLSGAAVAPGFVAAAGQNQRVQHLEGGIISRILVAEGDSVKGGEPVFELDAAMARAQRNRLQRQLAALQARAARLRAERDELESLDFPDGLLVQVREFGSVDVISEQQKEFAARSERYRQERVILGQRVQALQEQVSGMSAQLQALERQLVIVREETSAKKQLLEKGLTNRFEFAELMRAEAGLVGQIGQAEFAVLSAKTQIVEAQEQLARSGTQRMETAATQLNDVNIEISDAEEQLQAAETVLDRVVVRAPTDGRVVRLGHNAVGGVVRPGDTLLELLPTGQEFVVEARLLPTDVDVVKLGQAADLQFSALNLRTTPKVAAEIIYVSADRLTDETTGQTYYAARLKIAEELPDEIEAEQIYPGMPVEVFINTGERTFLEYLAKPVTDSLNRAFREE